MLLLVLLTFSILAPLGWLFYERIYKPYFDCQVFLEQTDSVLKEENKKLIGETAVIIGGSFTGLTSSIVLSKYYKKVIIVDRSKMVRDESITKNRQGEQPHVISYRATRVWDRLLPGFLDELKEYLKRNKLNQIVHPASEVKYYYKNEYGVSNHIDQRKTPLIMASRGQMETVLRDKIKKELANVEFLDGYQVSANGIKVESYEENGQQVTRVKSVTITDVSTETPKTIECSLFVNCAGAGSNNLMKNLENAVSPNKKLLTKSSIDCKIGYQTIFLEPKDSSYDKEGKVAIYREDMIDNKQENRKLNDPYYLLYYLLCYPNRRGFLVMPYSDNTFLFLLTTYNEKIDTIEKETAKEQIMEFVKHNPRMEREAKAVLEKFKDTPKKIVPYFEKNGSEYIHFENLKGVRDFIAVGDAVGSLNPIYGQGIIMGVDSVLLLDEMIKDQLKKNISTQEQVFQPSFCQDFQTRLSKSYMVPWLLCSTTDLRFDYVKYTKNLSFQKLISPMMGLMNDKLFMSANSSAASSYYLIKMILMEDGFRKELLNLYWLHAYVLRKETIIGMVVSLSVLIATMWMK